MKGVLFNVVQEVVEELLGEEGWDDLLDAAGSSGIYTALGDYPTAELATLVDAAASRLAIDPPMVLRTVGRHALPRLLTRLPPGMEPAAHAIEFIRSVNDIIHPEVLKLYPTSKPPVFECEPAEDGMIVRYRSDRNLPDLAHGLLEGVTDCFEPPTEVERLDDDRSDARFLVRVIGS